MHDMSSGVCSSLVKFQQLELQSLNVWMGPRTHNGMWIDLIINRISEAFTQA